MAFKDKILHTEDFAKRINKTDQIIERTELEGVN